MKKFIFLILAIFASISCNTMPDRKTYTIGENAVIHGAKFTLEDHDYIEIYRLAGEFMYDNCTGYVHDPECLKRDLEKWGFTNEKQNIQ